MTTKLKPPTEATIAANSALQRTLPFDDTRDFEEADRGFIAPLPEGGVIRNSEGRVVWDMSRFDFIRDDVPAPDTVNPSLWRQAQLVVKAGLYKVVDRIYQVRTADLANITFIEGDTGLIVVDPLVTAETARASLELYFEHRPRKPVVAVIISHSHVDHYGGIRGVVSEADVQTGKAMIIAPDGFMEAALSENVLAGNVMSRRAAYMFGNLLKPGPDGMVGAGLGISTSSGTITLLAPTHLITEPLQKMHIDGLDFEFMLTPDTEAPAEMHWYIEQLRALTAAENWSRTMHNTYTLRGASSRNVKSWSKYLNKTLDHWGHKSDVLYSMHHWPAWGTERIIEQLAIARDGYRYLHDQTLRLANQGYTPIEIAEMIDFPPEIARHWAMRGYYGAINHNVKGIYTRYLGWFDGNPANLHPLPPEESAQKYVALMGGADTVVAKGREAFEAGEYRWVAELAKHVVFAEPQHQGGRELLADAFEQMGYQAESGPWRNFYLTGAMELREGVKRTNVASTDSSDTVRALPVDLFLDYLGIRLNGPKALGKSIAISFHFTDTGEEAVLFLSNGALNHSMGRQDPNADATLTLTRVALDNILLRTSTMQQEVAGGALTITGDQAKVMEIVSLLDTFEFWFNLVTP